MNKFQSQFLSTLGLALGAKKILGTPDAPTPSIQPQSEEAEYKTLELGLGDQYFQTGAVSEEGRMALLAKERSLQNLRNRHNALRTIKKARQGELRFGGNK